MSTLSLAGFGALGVPDDLAARLTAVGITDPSPIQLAVIPDALAGRDVIGRAPTGSGKTLAFGVPLVANLAPARAHRPTALILAPTRELAQQIANALDPLTRERGHATTSIYGGVGFGPQRKALASGAELVVACPGRLEDLISMGAVALGDVRQVVVDEADRMADMGFLPAVKRILDQTNADRQVLLFTATLDGAVTKLAAAVQRNAVRHEVGAAGPDMSACTHLFWSVDRDARGATTAEVARRLGSTMVFTRTRHGADRVAKHLAKFGVSAAPIHGGRSQPQRDRALQAFSSGDVNVLVATDVAARGVHVDDVAAVVHYDPPADGATYVHRSGRTARAGASGVVVSLVETGGERDARTLQRDIGITADITAPTFDIPATPPAAVSAPERTSAAPRQAASPRRSETRPERQQRQARPARQPRQEPARHERPSGTRQVGTVAFFHTGRGYGFITPSDGSDVYVRRDSAAGKLGKGQRVEFTLRQGPKGLEAIDVVKV
ncbi:MAG TPA: DEAD/DEAH box helicase [Ilumatobacter sp.]|nr:DEAD/DEAH box helicase [Ilumatobacter sp.]